MTAPYAASANPPATAAPLHMAMLAADTDLDTCAALMATSDPWVRLGLDLQTCRRIVGQSERESWGAWQGHRLAGFVVLNFKGPFVGYVQLLGVAAGLRGQGVGAALVAHAEQCIFARTPNVFICVSSFNTAAQRFYARLGYQICGRLDNYLVAGHDELLLRKTRGPLLTKA